MVNPHKKSRCDLCMFEMETRKNILERLKQYYTETAGDKVNLVEGGFAWDTLSANAKEFEKAYAEMALIIEASFPQTSWGDWLTKKGGRTWHYPAKSDKFQCYFNRNGAGGNCCTGRLFIQHQ